MLDQTVSQVLRMGLLASSNQRFDRGRFDLAIQAVKRLVILVGQNKRHLKATGQSLLTS